MNTAYWRDRGLKSKFVHSILLIFGIWLSLPGNSLANSDNGFDLTEALVPAEQILSGGPPRDGIPAIDTPQFVAADHVDFLRPEQRVLGVSYNGVTKAYPISILNWHEIVNDSFADKPVAITFCPLCATGMVFDANIHGETRQFGVSGLLYKSDVLLYDRNSETLWSQLGRQAIAGPLRGQRLNMIATTHTTWQDWQKRHPKTLVLSTDTGYWRDYTRDPYLGYETSDRTFFPTGHSDTSYHPKELVIGLESGDSVKAYPFSELQGQAQHSITDQIAGKSLTITFDADERTGTVYSASGQEIPTVIAFWFAWSAFHPETAVYKSAIQ